MELKIKKTGEVVDVFPVLKDGKPMGMYFDTSGTKSWQVVAMKKFVPVDFPLEGFMSKTQRNKIKSRLQLFNPTWMATDGMRFTDIEEAIQHEKELMEEEKNTTQGEPFNDKVC